MAVPVFCCGFECGVAGTTGQHLATAGSGTSFDTTTFRTGLRAGRVNVTATTGSFQVNGLAASGTRVVRAYLRFTTLPLVDDVIILGSTPAAASTPCLAFKASDSKLYAGTVAAGLITFGATGVAVTTATWYRVDWRQNATANPWLTDAQIDGTAVGQLSSSIAADATGTTLDIGFTGAIAVTGDMYIDDWIVSNTGADYPFGGGIVTKHSPNRDGTHTTTGTDMLKALGGGAVTVLTTDAYTMVDDATIATGTSDFLGMQTSNALKYCEIGFASSTDTTAGPRAVQVIVGENRATTAQANSKFKINDNGTTQLLWNKATSTVAALTFNTTQYASMIGGGAWTKARFDALFLRWGYSTDAQPDVFFQAAMIEAEFSVLSTIAAIMTGAGAFSGPATAFRLTIPITAAI